MMDADILLLDSAEVIAEQQLSKKGDKFLVFLVRFDPASTQIALCLTNWILMRFIILTSSNEAQRGVIKR